MLEERIDLMIDAYRRGVVRQVPQRDAADILGAARDVVRNADLAQVIGTVASRLEQGGLAAPRPDALALALAPAPEAPPPPPLPPGRRPTFAFVLANYNDSKWLHRSLRGICGQSRKPDQVIVIDDCSTDDSVGLVSQFAAQYDFLTLKRNAVNRGTLGAIASHWAAVEADYVVFAAADDLVAVDMLATMEQIVVQNPDVGAVQALTYVWFPDTDRVVVDMANQQIARMYGKHAPGEFRRLLLTAGMTIQGNVACFRKGLIDRHGMFDPTLEHVGDTHLFQQHLLAGGVYYTDKILGIHTRHANQYSTLRVRDTERRVRIHATFLDRLGQPGQADYRADLLRYPSLLENFPALIGDIAWRPDAWDLLLSYASWFEARRAAAAPAASPFTALSPAP